MPGKYEVDSVIICDEIRTEVTGKQILIGVYAGVMLFSHLPIQIPKLVFRIQARTEAVISEFTFVIRTPNNDIAGTVTDVIPPYDPSEPIILNIAVGGIAVGAGVYAIELGLDDEPTKVQEFLVRQPKNDEEKQRLAS